MALYPKFNPPPSIGHLKGGYGTPLIKLKHFKPTWNSPNQSFSWCVNFLSLNECTICKCLVDPRGKLLLGVIKEVANNPIILQTALEHKK